MFLIAFVAIIVVYLAVAIGTTYGLTKFGKSSGAKWAIGVASSLAFLILAFGDEVWGPLYLRHLCESESGIKVYSPEVLGPEHWNADGSPAFSLTLKPFLNGRYEVKGTGTTVLRWPNLVRSESAVVNRVTNEKLASYVNFTVQRGWFLSSPGWHAGGSSCPQPQGSTDAALAKAAFRKPFPIR